MSPKENEAALKKDLAHVLNCHGIDTRLDMSDNALAENLIGLLKVMADEYDQRELGYKETRYSSIEVESN